MRKIDLNCPEVSKGITRLYELYLSLAEEVEKMTEYAANMDIFWDGDANAAFMQKILDDLARVAVFLIKVRDTIGLARSAFDIYTDAEKDVRAMLQEYNIT